MQPPRSVEEDEPYRFLASQLRVVAGELLRKTMMHVNRKQQHEGCDDVNLLWQTTLRRVREFDMTSEASYLCCLVLSVSPTKANLKTVGLDAAKTCGLMDAVARRFVAAFYPGRRPSHPLQREDLLRFMGLFVQSLCDWPAFRSVDCVRQPAGLDEAYRAVIHTTWSRWAVLAETEPEEPPPREPSVVVAASPPLSAASGRSGRSGSRISRPPASYRSAPVSGLQASGISLSPSLEESVRLPADSPTSEVSLSPLPASFADSGAERSVQLSDGGGAAASYRDPFGADEAE